MRRFVALMLSGLLLLASFSFALADDASAGAPPELPDGAAGGTPPDGAAGGTPPDGAAGAPGGGSSAPTEYSAVYSYDDDVTGGVGVRHSVELASTGTDENAVLVKSGKLILHNVAITRESADSSGGDSSSFYGVGAAALAISGKLGIEGSTITTDAAGGAGAFAYGDSEVFVRDTVITTNKNTSGGIHAAGGGTLYAKNVTAETQGESSAAVRSDRGGGTMFVDGGKYTSNGTGSPAVYSTADITIKNASLLANNSEAVCIEGLNSLRLENCELSGNMPDNSQNDTKWNVILYQSMSGDSEVGNSTFQMVGGKLTAGAGGMFYSTNTESTFVLKDVDIEYAPENLYFLRVTGNANERGWGSSGANGADTSFTAYDQEMEGDVIWDSISKLDFYMIGNSALEGAFTDDETNAGSARGSGYAKLYMAENTKWVVSADSSLTGLYAAPTAVIVDAEGLPVRVENSEGSVLREGSSDKTVTVSDYSEEPDFSVAADIDAASFDYDEAYAEAMSYTAESEGTADDASESYFVNGFTDVPSTAWFAAYVEAAVEQGIAAGISETSFGPNMVTTRAQFVTFLYRLDSEGLSALRAESEAATAATAGSAAAESEVAGSVAAESEPLSSFNDVPSGSWYEEAVAWAAAKGIVSGYPDGSFRPSDTVTREQIAAMIYRYEGEPEAYTLTEELIEYLTEEYGLTSDEASERAAALPAYMRLNYLNYVDSEEISDYAMEAVEALISEGIIGGKKPSAESGLSEDELLIDPKGRATRAETLTMLLRLREYYAQLALRRSLGQA